MDLGKDSEWIIERNLGIRSISSPELPCPEVVTATVLMTLGSTIREEVADVFRI